MKRPAYTNPGYSCLENFGKFMPGSAPGAVYLREVNESMDHMERLCKSPKYRKQYMAYDRALVDAKVGPWN